jgi:hypothetical protein
MIAGELNQFKAAGTLYKAGTDKKASPRQLPGAYFIAVNFSSLYGKWV